MIAIVSDTHMPKGRRELPERCLQLLAAADLIVHVGDFSGEEVLDRFEAIGPPLVAVCGNVEAEGVRRRLPGEAELTWAGSSIAVVHDAGPRPGRLDRLRLRFPGAAAVIFGHSHLPLLERAPDGFQIFNPGSPTERRRAPTRSMGLLRTGSGGELEFELVAL